MNSQVNRQRRGKREKSPWVSLASPVSGGYSAAWWPWCMHHDGLPHTFSSNVHVKLDDDDYGVSSSHNGTKTVQFYGRKSVLLVCWTLVVVRVNSMYYTCLEPPPGKQLLAISRINHTEFMSMSVMVVAAEVLILSIWLSPNGWMICLLNQTRHFLVVVQLHPTFNFTAFERLQCKSREFSKFPSVLCTEQVFTCLKHQITGLLIHFLYFLR